jgi:ferrochelatase
MISNKSAILLANLGSPDSTNVKDVRSYLQSFLMDEKVIDLPYLFRLLLMKGLVIPLRAPQSAEKYKRIWTPEGSPLLVITRALSKLVQEESQLPTYFCMRYGNPSAADVLANIERENPELNELILFPLYPHFAMSSYQTAVQNVQEAHLNGKYRFTLRVVEPYYKQADYISALVDAIKPFLAEEPDHILFSYHGIPERHLVKTDPTRAHCLKSENCCQLNNSANTHQFCYKHQVLETTQAVAKELGLEEEMFSVSFQSRLGPDKWLAPATANVFKSLPSKGVLKLAVVCPAFVSDCLETLEEINMEGKELFLNAGGNTFIPIPCLNVSKSWVKTIVKLTST